MKKGPSGPKHKGAYPAYMGKLRDVVSSVAGVFGASGGFQAAKVYDNAPTEKKVESKKEKAPSKKSLPIK